MTWPYFIPLGLTAYAAFIVFLAKFCGLNSQPIASRCTGQLDAPRRHRVDVSDPTGAGVTPGGPRRSSISRHLTLWAGTPSGESGVGTIDNGDAA